MYTLVSRLAEDRGRDELQTRFEAHVHSQGVAAIEKCGESAQNVREGEREEGGERREKGKGQQEGRETGRREEGEGKRGMSGRGREKEKRQERSTQGLVIQGVLTHH